MGIELFIFYVLAVVLVGASLAVITVRNPVFAALFLVLAFFNCAGIWLLLEAEFLALSLVLVYVGAVMVLFLFVVMMLDINVESLKKDLSKYIPVGMLIGLILLVQLSMVVSVKQFGVEKSIPPPRAIDYNNTREIGLVLYTDYLYPFEIAAVILLVAIIAAITLTMRKRTKKKFMTPDEQVVVKKADRVRLVNIPAVKKK